MMFESAMKAQIKTIFDFKKVTYDPPSESREQECCFIEIQLARPVIKDGMQRCRVRGKLRVFGNVEKMPYGYFMKRIKLFPAETKDFFFFDFEENVGSIGNIAERSMAFEYFYSSQFDPDLGTITSIETEVTET